MEISSREYGKLPDGSSAMLYLLSNGKGMEVDITNFGGIVTAINYLGGRYYISSSTGGAWNGLFVYDNNYSPNIGDSILISGTIDEYNGYTEIKDLSSFNHFQL